MSDKKDLLQRIVLSTIHEVLEVENKKFHMDDELYSKLGLFDSMDLVNFISLLEEKVFINFNKNLQLTDASMFSTSRSPFKNFASTIDFIYNLL